MITFKLFGHMLYCDKCGNIINENISIATTPEHYKKYKIKKSYCGKCIQRRIKHWKNFPDFWTTKERW